MELTNDFKVSVPIDSAWDVLTDVERIAPCLPGAELDSVEGEEYRGTVKVKVGPITAQYKGKATFERRDADARVAVLRAEGRDTRGQGNASATITATLKPEGDDRTAVSVVTDLTVTGKVAQFGRGVLGDVSAKLMRQFVENLERDILSSSPSEEASASSSSSYAPSGSGSPRPSQVSAGAEAREDSAGAAKPDSRDNDSPTPSGPAAETPPRPRPEVQPLDLLDVAGGSVAKRVLPMVAGAVVSLLLLRRLRRRRRRR